MGKNKAVYILGGGQLGRNIIRWAKEIGLAVILTDKNAEAPGLKLADLSFVTDSSNYKAHIGFIKSIEKRYQITGVYCGNETGIETIYHISKYLGLFYHPLEAVEKVLDKVKMKKVWMEAGISSPKFYLIKNPEDLKEILINSQCDYILKPSLGSGSRGVNLVNKYSNFEEIYKNCLEAVENKGSVILEEFIEGRSIDANGLILNGEFFPAGILEKFSSGYPNFLPLSGYDPADLTKDEENEVYSLFEKSCKLLGLCNGPVKGDFIKTENGFQVLEVAPRFHGDVTTSHTLPYGTGINPVKFLFHYFKTRKLEKKYLITQNRRLAIWRVLCLPPGKLKLSENGFNTGGYPANITMLWINEKLNNLIGKYTDTSKIPGYVCAFGKNKLEAENHIFKYLKQVNFEVEVNNDEAEWYDDLGKILISAGISLESCGYKIKK